MPRTPGGLLTLAEQGPPSPHRRRALRWLVGTLVVVLAVAGWLGWREMSDRLLTPTCVASVGTLHVELSPEQAANAAVISAVARRRGLPTHAATIAIATAMQESKLRNLRYGDRDSLGLFQQRPSQGWGTPEQILDPVYASGEFYERLVTVRDYLTRPVTDVAQAVQRSAAPQAYAQHEDEARVLAATFVGEAPAALTCTLHRVDRPGDPTRLATTLRAHHGVAAEPTGGPDLRVPLDGADASRHAWSIAAWAIAHADAFGIEQVLVGASVWSRADATWSGASAQPAMTAPVEVRLRLAAS
jgi:hypothetical protein